ncbi:MAG: hypothetical protein SPK59_01555, partial [Eubacteriales bacterium]|nr:hypothetical protein [Eubacteriales bacterium]
NWIEYCPPTAKVVGSTPIGCTKKRQALSCRFFIQADRVGISSRQSLGDMISKFEIALKECAETD